jgi:hypothetical protein
LGVGGRVRIVIVDVGRGHKRFQPLSMVVEYAVDNKIFVDEIGHSLSKNPIGHGGFSKVETEIPVSQIQRHWNVHLRVGDKIIYKGLTDTFPEKVNLTFLQLKLRYKD